MKYFIFGLMIWALAGCSQKSGEKPALQKEDSVEMKKSESPVWEAKVDPRLKSVLRQGDGGQVVEIFVDCNAKIDSALTAKVARLGIQIGTAHSSWFTASGTVLAVKELAILAEIKYIKLTSIACPPG